MKKIMLTIMFAFLSVSLFAQTTIPITFAVNMKIQAEEGYFNPLTDHIYIRGNFQVDVGDASDWSGTTFTATSPNQDSIYSLTINFPDSLVGKDVAYKFVLNDGGWESLPTNATYPDGNRHLIVTAPSMTLPVAYYNDDSVLIVQATNILNVTVDLSSIYGTGKGFFDPNVDSLVFQGLFGNGSVVSGNRTLTANDPIHPWIYSTSLVIKDVQGDSTQWKLRAFPDSNFFNGGWEVANNYVTAIGPDSSTTEIPTFVPTIFPIQPALATVGHVLFQVDMNNAVNKYTQQKIDPKTILIVGVKGQNPVLGGWAGNWLPSDTVTTDSTQATLITLNDSGKNGDKVAGDGIWSGLVTFPVGNVGGPGLFKYGFYYAGEDTLNGGYHPMDNEFLDGSVNHWVDVKAGDTVIVNNKFGDPTNYSSLTGVKKENNLTPEKYTLDQNYPNPFNPSTVIRYSVPKSQLVTLKVYNLLGQEVATLVNNRQNAGNYQVTFNADKLASGIYFYNLNTAGFNATKKMILLK